MFEPQLDPHYDYDPMEEWVHVDDLKKYDDAKKYLQEEPISLNILFDILPALHRTGAIYDSKTF